MLSMKFRPERYTSDFHANGYELSPLESEGKVEKYKAWLVAKGYSQVEGIDFGEIFSVHLVITEISSANQIVMRSPMDQNYHKSISKRSKTIQPVIKLRCAMTT
jgi:hypothetical protein